MKIQIYHNPKCATSRNSLAMILASGEIPEIIEYLQTPLTRERLVELIKNMCIRPRALLRQKDTPFDELNLGDETLTDAELIDAMISYPILINRPIVVSEKGARLCRPSELVLDLLAEPVKEFIKEDGEVVHYSGIARVANDDTLVSLPNIDLDKLHPIDIDALAHPNDSRHPPRILVLYGSLRERSFSRLVAEEAVRLLRWYGCEVRTFNPSGLPLPDDADSNHPKVQELRELTMWSEGMMWISPERHGAMTGIMKTQIDWIPLALGGIRPTQGKTLAVMQVSGGSQSFNAVNQMRILGRWMRMITIPNQSSVPKAFTEFNDEDRMNLSPRYLRIVDVCEELVKFTRRTRGRPSYLTDRYSERIESVEAVSQRVNQGSI